MTSFEQTSLFNYELPSGLIASSPAERRSDARLLALPPDGGLVDLRFSALPSLLRAEDLLVVNDTRVLPARLHARRSSGGRVEILVLGISEEGRWESGEGPIVALHRSSKSLGEGEPLSVEGLDVTLVFLGRDDKGRSRFRYRGDVLTLIEQAGALPLPPYIVRERAARGEAAISPSDAERYQTVFATVPGSVAAPTAGLHFDDALLQTLEQRGVRRAAITLDVGTGTFRPVGEAGLEHHAMHVERFFVPEATVAAIAETRSHGGRVVAVGTTVVRALEAACLRGAGDGPVPGEDRTDLMITPGFRFRAVDALLTNFHLPRSTLLALVAAFGGTGRIEQAYRHAVVEGYRFYSYGDAMFIDPMTDREGS